MGPAEHGEKTGIWVINVLSATPRQVRGDAEGAVASPDGALIAFRHSTGQGAVSVVDVSGEHVRPLLTAEPNETFGKLEWSPDGKRVAAIVRRAGDPSVSIDAVDLDTRKRSELVRQPNLRTFVWLPDGRLLFVTQGHEQGDLAVLHELAPRGNERRLDLGSDVAPADISSSADGKRLVLIRSKVQSDVYAGEMNAKAVTGLERITLDDRDDRPTGWLRDNKTFIFESNRNGTLDIFRQSLQSPAAEMVVGGPDVQFGAQEAPDARTILYWSRAQASSRVQLMSVPVGGGPATALFDAPAGSQFHCAVHADTCTLASPADGKIQVSEFSPHGGPPRPVREVVWEVASAGATPWALDGSPARLAFLSGGRLHVTDVATRASWEIAESDLPGKVTGLAFAGHSGELLVTTGSARENVVLRVDRSGVHRLCDFPRAVASPILSPDGKRLLLEVTSASSNAWLVENF